MTNNERQSIQQQLHDMEARTNRQFDYIGERLEKSHIAVAGTVSKLVAEQREKLEAHEKDANKKIEHIQERLATLATIEALDRVELKAQTAMKWQERILWIGIGLAIALPQLSPLLATFGI